MKYYIGCDVSMKAISVCVMEGSGKKKLCKDIAASPETLLMVIKPYLPHCLVGLEAGSTTSWLFHGLQKAGVNVICMEAHHARKALSAQPVKTDRNDAEGLAQLLRTGWYKSVHVKQEDTQELKCWIEAREMLKHKQQDIKNAIRGLVKPFGIILPSGAEHPWIEKVKNRLAHERAGLSEVVKPLLAVYEVICNEVATYTRFIEKVAKEDEVCRRLQTIDGIGPVNAVAFKAIIEHPERFDSNRNVGAYLGMTPRIYASGETEWRGRITRAGSDIMRTYLFEAAQVLLTRTKRMSCLKSWGLRLCKRKSAKLVIAALARKLAVLMLAIWKNGTTFQPTREKLSLAMAG